MAWQGVFISTPYHACCLKGSIGSSTTRSNYNGGTTTDYYDKYGGYLGSSTDW